MKNLLISICIGFVWSLWPLLININKITHPLGMFMVTGIACIPFGYMALTTPLDHSQTPLSTLIIVGLMAAACNTTGLLLYPEILKQEASAPVYIISITIIMILFTALLSYILKPNFSLDKIELTGILCALLGVILLNYKNIFPLLQK